MLGSVEWHRAGPNLGQKPVVVLLLWVMAKKPTARVHYDLYCRLGCDVLAYYPPTLSLWSSYWAQCNAEVVLKALSEQGLQGGPRPVVFVNFSGAPKMVYYKLLHMLAGMPGYEEYKGRYRDVQHCCAGQIYDSSPVDFTSEAGVLLLSQLLPATIPRPLSLITNSAATFTAGLLDFFFLERFTRDDQAMWSALRHACVPGPVLFLYSRDDPLACPHMVQSLAVGLRNLGRMVVEQVWDESPHVQHLRYHREEYEEAVGYFLSLMWDDWNRRSGKRDLQQGTEGGEVHGNCEELGTERAAPSCTWDNEDLSESTARPGQVPETLEGGQIHDTCTSSPEDTNRAGPSTPPAPGSSQMRDVEGDGKLRQDPKQMSSNQDSGQWSQKNSETRAPSDGIPGHALASRGVHSGGCTPLHQTDSAESGPDGTETRNDPEGDGDMGQGGNWNPPAGDVDARGIGDVLAADRVIAGHGDGNIKDSALIRLHRNPCMACPIAWQEESEAGCCAEVTGCPELAVSNGDSGSPVTDLGVRGPTVAPGRQAPSIPWGCHITTPCGVLLHVTSKGLVGQGDSIICGSDVGVNEVRCRL